MNNIKALPWDSDFFNLNVGQVNLTDSKEISEFNDEYLNSSFDLVYVTVTTEIIQKKIVDIFETAPIENKLTYALAEYATSLIAAKHEIVEISQVTESLLQLTFESGSESRFYKDPKIGKANFEKLYTTWIEKSVNHELADHVFGVFISDQLAGFVTLSLKNNTSQIGLIAVSKEFRGQGVAKSLIEHCLLKALENGCMPMKIVTQAHNLAACNLYKSMGFVEISSVPLFHFWKSRL